MFKQHMSQVSYRLAPAKFLWLTVAAFCAPSHINFLISIFWLQLIFCFIIYYLWSLKFLIQYIMTTVFSPSPPSFLHPNQSPLYPRPLLYIFFHKKVGLQEISVKHDTTRYKTRYKPSYWTWMMQLKGGNEIQKKAKESETPLLSLMAVPQTHK